MRCQKCGYTSFDFLSQCKKCGVDLVTIRDALGFDGAKPAIPFLLGALLKGYSSSGGRKKDMGEQYSEIEFGEFEMDATESAPRNTAGSEAGLNAESGGLAFRDMTRAPKAYEGQTTGGAPKTSTETSAAESVQPSPLVSDELDFDVDFLLDPEPAQPASASAADAGAAAKAPLPASEHDLAIDISAEELQILMDEIESVPPSGASPQGRASAPMPGASSAPPDADENLVIELSEKDLENLLLDLDETQGPETKRRPT